MNAAIVVLQAVVSTYVATVVGVAFILGPHTLTPTGLVAGLFGLGYTFLPGVAGLLAAYLWMRRVRCPNWLEAMSCALWGALVGLLWFAFGISKDSYLHFYFNISPSAGISYILRMYPVLLMHVVPGAVGGLVFWLLTRVWMQKAT